MRVLLMLREDRQVFQYLVKVLDDPASFAGMTLPPKFLENFATDLVVLFFADFSSTEKNVVSILRQFEGLIQKLFKGFANGEFPYFLKNENLWSTE
jgi:hypothetical protein